MNGTLMIPKIWYITTFAEQGDPISVLSPLIGKSTICSPFARSSKSRNTSLNYLQYLCLTILFNNQSMSKRLNLPPTQNGEFLYWSNRFCSPVVNCFKSLILFFGGL